MHNLPVLAILAGGRATRMLPETRKVAKSMLPVAGEPFLGHQLRWAVEQGIRNIVLCCGHLGEQLEAFAEDGTAWGCQIRYSFDGSYPLGTGGALRKALPLLGAHFFVMYGDSMLTVSLRAAWQTYRESNKLGLMTVFPNINRWDTSNVSFKSGEILAYSKTDRTSHMQHIDYGLNCFASEAFSAWSVGSTFDLAEVHQRLLQKKQLAGFEVGDRFYEIGSHAGYAELNEHVERRTIA